VGSQVRTISRRFEDFDEFLQRFDFAAGDTSYKLHWADETVSLQALIRAARFRVSVTITMMDLLTAARNYGALVDGEMVKYIRSTVLVDGVVSRLSPGLDLAHALRNVVEEYLFEQSRKKVVSPGGLITMLTDMAIWMRTGPSSMVRAVELFERRQINLKTFARPEQDLDRPLRVRILTGAAVWALAVVYLALGGASATLRDSPSWAIIVKVFVTSWTIWLILLLRRLTLVK
jgi:hypothetical protein